MGAVGWVLFAYISYLKISEKAKPYLLEKG